MAINKVIYDGSTLIDLSADSLSDPSQLAEGVTAHDRSGTLITGTASDNYILTYDEEVSVGTALVGEAVTTEPNYTPSGDVIMDYEIVGKKLYIKGFRFNGSGVKFAIEKEQ